MTARGSAGGPGRRRALRPVVAVTTLVAGALLAGCSDRSESAVVTTTTRPPTPEASLPDQGASGQDQAEEPLEPDWVLQVGGSGEDTLAASAGRRDEVVAVGSSAGLGTPAAGPSDVLVVTAAANDGTLRTSTLVGSPGSDSGRAVGAAPTGAALACGETDGELGSLPAGGTDVWCAPIDGEGLLGPVQQAGSGGDDLAGGAALTEDGSYGYVVGSSDGLYPGAQDPTGLFIGLRDALVLRTDTDGLGRWARQFGTAEDDRADAVASTEDGDAAVAGSTTDPGDDTRLGAGDAWLARLDPSGNQRWLTLFGTTGTDATDAVATGGQASRGTEVIVGAGSTTGALPDASSAGATDVLVGATNSSGRLVWNTQFGSPGDDAASGVVVDGSTTYVAGTASQPIEGAERVALPGAEDAAGGGRDGFLAALDSATGELRWVVLFGSAGDEDVTGLGRTEDGHLVVSGATTGRLGATPPAGATDGFLVAFPLPATGGGAASVL